MTKSTDTPVWSGIGLPPVGADVIFNTASSGDVVGTVTGYHTLPSLTGDRFCHRVFVDLVYKGTDIPNCRMLSDLKPLPEEQLPQSRACQVRRPRFLEWVRAFWSVLLGAAVMFALANINLGLDEGSLGERAIAYYVLAAAIGGIAMHLSAWADLCRLGIRALRNARARRLLETDSTATTNHKE